MFRAILFALPVLALGCALSSARAAVGTSTLAPTASTATMTSHHTLMPVKKRSQAAALSTAAPAAVSATPAPVSGSSVPATDATAAPMPSTAAVAMPESAPASSRAPAPIPVTVPASPIAGGAPSVPVRGMDMANVEHIFGAPVDKVAPVGKPPITRWVYPDYVVYFEYNMVLHTVMKAMPFGEGTTNGG